MEYTWWTFFGIAALMTLTPGADTVLVIRNAIGYGKNAALLTTLGICSGLLIHAGASGLGLSVILSKSAHLYQIVKLAGAWYLIYLGTRTIYAAWRDKKSPQLERELENQALAGGRSFGGYFTQGFLTNVLNPKVAIFYLTILPQFIDTSYPAFPQALGLAGLHILQGLVWLGACGYFVSYMRSALSRPNIWRRIETASGAVLVAFGLTVALNER